MPEKKVKGFVSVPKEIKDKAQINNTQAFKSEVEDEKARFPKELGAEHPYNFEFAQKLYETHSYVKGFIDKQVDYIVGNFSTKAKTDKAQAIIDAFIINTNLQVDLREWIKNALITGNGFLELDLDEEKVQLINPAEMYVKRTKTGKVIEFNQFKGNLKRFSKGTIKPISFSPEKIAHLKINYMPGAAYGLGEIKPNFKTLDHSIKEESDVQSIISRKAGAPYHIKVGIPGEQTEESTVSDFANEMQYLSNTHEWVTDANVEISAVNFGELGKGLFDILNFRKQQLFAGFQVPQVLMGEGSIPEGLAKAQGESFQKRCKSLQENIEKVIEEKIFRSLLQKNGLDEHVEFQWNLPSEDYINKKIEQFMNLLSGKVNVDENLRRMAQIQIANLLEIPNYDRFLREPEVGLDDQIDEEKKQMMQDQIDTPSEKDKFEKKSPKNSPEAKKESKIKQPEVPGEKPNAKLMNGCGCGQHLTEADSGDLTVKEWVNLQEVRGFTYSDYLAKIIQITKNDNFPELLAESAEDLELGLLPEKEVGKLKEILKTGFKKNQTIRQIQTNIEKNVNIPDRYRINENGEKVLSLSAGNRPNAIARTETNRLANKGLIEHYKENKIEKVRFLAALSDRTCPICEELNSRVYPIEESDGVIPVHTACRCTFIPVVE